MRDARAISDDCKRMIEFFIVAAHVGKRVVAIHGDENHAKNRADDRRHAEELEVLLYAVKKEFVQIFSPKINFIARGCR